MNKEVRQIVKSLERQGWRCARASGGHYLAFPPDRTRPMVTISSTPGGCTWKRKALADLRRAGASI